ncbi:hypothetical protein [Saccharicrinis sp. GN24d3]|uniref:hypothetical protein n=1 Tax=Saccharicrinis sp. GN24d3 TaxID=3458416 RepID=UPI004035151D
MMNKLLLVFITIFALGLGSCEKDSITQEVPGEIPGLGDTSGQLEITENFELPDDILLEGVITGLDEQETATSLKSLGDLACYGSGSEVKLKITLQNKGIRSRTVFFPKGLIWECTGGNFQHGIQIQTTWLRLNPGQTRTVTIYLYCANLGLPRPDNSAIYRILGVTSSKVLMRLLDLIGWRMVNYEMVVGNSLKSASMDMSYEEIVEKLQTIVHNLTDRGIDLREEDIEFIESIPELPLDKRPEVDENGNYPDDFEEFLVSGE